MDPFSGLPDLTNYTEEEMDWGPWDDPNDAIEEFEHLIPESDPRKRNSDRI